MTRVAHVVTTYSGAVSILATKLAALDAYDDLDVTVLTGPKPTDRELGDPPVRHISVPIVRPIRPFADLRTVSHLAGVFRRERFDVVHSHTSKAGIVATLAARRAKVPLILHTYHGLAHYDGQPRLPYYVYRTFERFACRYRDHVFSQNHGDLPECARLIGSEERASYEGNGVDAERVRARAAENVERAERDYPGDGLRIAMVSRLEPVKRVHVFLQVCEGLRRDGVAFSAVIAGQGPLENALRTELTNRGLESCVRILGWTPHVCSLVAVADVVTLTSEKESVPRALMEAMALGKPIVATDVPGTRELVTDGQTGHLTPLDDIEAMIVRIKALADNVTLRASIGAAGTRRVEEHFNDLKIAAFLRDFYLRECAARSPRPS